MAQFGLFPLKWGHSMDVFRVIQPLPAQPPVCTAADVAALPPGVVQRWRLENLGLPPVLGTQQV